MLDEQCLHVDTGKLDQNLRAARNEAAHRWWPLQELHGRRLSGSCRFGETLLAFQEGSLSDTVKKRVSALFPVTILINGDVASSLSSAQATAKSCPLRS